MSIKTTKSLINQGFRIKNKHRFYDTASYHNYCAFLVGVTRFWTYICAHYISYSKPSTRKSIRLRRRSSSSVSTIKKSLRGTRPPEWFLVGVTRFELAASWSRTKRTTKLCHTPKIIYNYRFFKCLLFLQHHSSIS